MSKLQFIISCIAFGIAVVLILPWAAIKWGIDKQK